MSALRRLTAIMLLLGIVGALAWLAVIPAIEGYLDNQQAIVDSKDQIERFTRILSRRDALEAATVRLQQALDTHAGFLQDADSTRAAANLQDRIKTMVTAGGGKLISFQLLPMTEVGPYQQVSVRIRMLTSGSVLRDVLYGLQSGVPVLSLDNLKVVTMERRRNTQADSNEHDSMDVRFDVAGLLKLHQS